MSGVGWLVERYTGQKEVTITVWILVNLSSTPMSYTNISQSQCPSVHFSDNPKSQGIS